MALQLTCGGLDEEALYAVVDGMINIPTIVGLKIKDREGKTIAIAGVIEGAETIGNTGIHVSLQGCSSEDMKIHKNGQYEYEIFGHTFPITYNFHGTSKAVGEGTIYSNSSVIFRRVKLEVTMLAINITLTLAVFALVLIWATGKYLRQPLQILTNATSAISLDNLGSFSIDTKTSVRNEIKVLEETMIEMVSDLHCAIEKRASVEQSLRESETRFRTLVDNIPGITYRSANDEHWTMEFISDEVEEIAGYKSSDFIGNKVRSFSSIIHPDDSDIIEKEVTYAIEHKKPYTLEYRLVKADGEPCWVFEKGQATYEGEDVVYFDGVIFDINDLKQADQELKNLRNYLSNIINSMPSTLIGVDPEVNITQWNTEAEKSTGITAENAVGKPLSQILPHLARVMEHIHSAIRNKKGYYHPKQDQMKDGHTVYEDLTVYPLTGDGARGAVIRIDDVTERVKLENMMVQTEKMQSIGGLAAGMAHEINNPLGGIMQGYQNILNRIDPQKENNQKVAERFDINLDNMYDYLADRKIITFLNGGKDACERAAQIVRNMLMFSRKSDSTPTMTELDKLIDHAIELGSSDYDLKKKYDFKFINIVKEYEPDLPQVMCCASEIEQVLLNLFKNALQAMEEATSDEYSPQFTIRLAKETEYIRIEVEDNGPGIPDDVKSRIFEPFFTTKGVGVGTGLGLSVSYMIITQNHNGRFEVESKKGEGAKFIIRLPRGKSPA